MSSSILGNDLKLKSKDGQFLIDNIIDINEDTKSIIKEYGFSWVEFEITVGNDSVVITKFYDLHFGTPKENVSTATERYSKNNYPVGGFTPGFENKKCDICNNHFIGDYNASQCEICVNDF